jgi:hypothetical protein
LELFLHGSRQLQATKGHAKDLQCLRWE